MKAIVINFGRYQGVHKGHELLINFICNKASELNADYRIFPSASYDSNKNPIPFDIKTEMIKAMLPQHANNIETKPYKSIVMILKQLQVDGYTHVYFVCGSDRYNSFNAFLPNYNHIEYDFDIIEVIAVGNDRVDTLDDSIESSSASKLRECVINDDMQGYIQLIPSSSPIFVAANIFNSMRAILLDTENAHV